MRTRRTSKRRVRWHSRPVANNQAEQSREKETPLPPFLSLQIVSLSFLLSSPPSKDVKLKKKRRLLSLPLPPPPDYNLCMIAAGLSFSAAVRGHCGVAEVEVVVGGGRGEEEWPRRRPARRRRRHRRLEASASSSFLPSFLPSPCFFLPLPPEACARVHMALVHFSTLPLLLLLDGCL